MFGTFANPRAHREQVGFVDGASARIEDMLIGRDGKVQMAAAPTPNSPNIAKAIRQAVGGPKTNKTNDKKTKSRKLNDRFKTSRLLKLK